MTVRSDEKADPIMLPTDLYTESVSLSLRKHTSDTWLDFHGSKCNKSYLLIIYQS